jgi:hypothetical protein
MKADADVLEFYIINDLLNNSDVITCTLVGAAAITRCGAGVIKPFLLMRPHRLLSRLAGFPFFVPSA